MVRPDESQVLVGGREPGPNRGRIDERECFSSGLGGVGAGSVLDVVQAAILLALLFHQATSDQVLKLFVSAETKHFLPTTHGISRLKIFVHYLKEIVEPEGLLV